MIRLFVSQSSVPSLLTLFCRDLEKRGLISLSHPPLKFHKKENALSAIPNVLYAGFDPTAGSFHVGNLLVIINLLRASLFRCQGIALIGGATGQIGDPSGRTTDRIALPVDTISENAKNLLKQLVEISENASRMCSSRLPLSIVNNMEWYDQMSAIRFLQIGRSFRVGEMLRNGPIKARMVPGRGISFAEFSYPIFQSYDWYILAKRYNCYFQLGGSDQLGNLESGQEFIQRQLGALSYGICLPLITDTKGQKLGKSIMSSIAKVNDNSTTVSNDAEHSTANEVTQSTQFNLPGVWLDQAKTSPFALYQYFRQLPDVLVERFLMYYSLRPIDELEDILVAHRAEPNRWLAQTCLADEMVELVHGKEGLDLAKRCSQILFSGKLNELEHLNVDTICSLFGKASTFYISRNSVHTFGDLAEMTQRDKRKCGSTAMREGSFYVNGRKFCNSKEPIRVEEFVIRREFSVISWGKRNYSLVRWT